MNAQHTPGPWHTAGEQGVQIRSAKHQIAKVWAMRGNEWKANARLIAAAPDLLAALHRAHTLLSELNYSEWIKKTDPASIDIRQRINAAHVVVASSIAKATRGTA
jgi:putative SOS response-associated peptidase YedK